MCGAEDAGAAITAIEIADRLARREARRLAAATQCDADQVEHELLGPLPHRRRHPVPRDPGAPAGQTRGRRRELRRRGDRHRYFTHTRSPKKKSCPCAIARTDCVFTSSTKNPPRPTYATRSPNGDHAGTTSSPVCPTLFSPDPSHVVRYRSDGMFRCAIFPPLLPVARDTV